MYTLRGRVYTSVLQRRQFFVSKIGRRKRDAREAENKLLMFDYQEYLKDPADFFMRKERWSFDGG